MHHRTLPRVTVVLVAVAALVLAPRPAAAADVKYGEKPNVLFIAIDDLNHWVGHLGRNKQAATPNIDRLAKRGVSFSRAYCAAPSCTPSRAALMSGLRPSTTGIYDNHNDWRPVIPAEKCLPAQFRKGGYRALGAGKIYHGERRAEWDDYIARGSEDGADPNRPRGRARLPQGADTGVGGIRFAPLDCDDADLPDYRIADYGIEQLGKTHEKPFFLAVGLHKPHMPWNVPRKWFDKFPLEQIELPPTIANDLADVPPAGMKMAKPDGDHARMVESGRWKEAVRAYLASIAYTDMNVGRLLDALDKSAHKDNTIVVLWGDHGWHLGEKEHWRKFALWEEATRAPLVWVAPGVTTGAACERAVDFMSIYPTLLDLCGLPLRDGLEGESLVPLLKDPSAKRARPALTTHGRGNHAVRSGRYRYIRYADGSEELYDHDADPNEWKNLAADAAHAAAKAELSKWLPSASEPDAPTRAARAADR